MKEIKVCMGSSCYVRGNKDNVKVLRDFVESNGLGGKVSIKGVLCSDNCGRGPVITVDGELFQRVDGSLIDELCGKLL